MGTKINIGTTPNDGTGDTIRDSFAITNKLIPETRATWTPSSWSLTDKENYFSDYSQSGALTIATPTNSYGLGAGFMLNIVTDGSNITFPNNFDIVSNDGTQVSGQEFSFTAGTYNFMGFWNGGKFVCAMVEATITIDTTPPTLTSATVENATDNQVDLVFSEAVTLTNLGFSLSGIASTPTISSISGSGTANITLNLSASVVESDVPLLSYDSGTGDCQDASGNPLASFTDTAVTNNVSDLIVLNAPVLSNVVVDSDTQITVTITDTNTSPNEVNTLMQYKEQTSGTWLNHGTAAQDATSYAYDGLTASTDYDFQAIAQGDDVTTSDSVASNTVQGTTDAAAAVEFLNLSQSSGFTLTGTTYTGSNGSNGVCIDRMIAAGDDGYITFDWENSGSTNGSIQLGYKDTQTDGIYTTWLSIGIMLSKSGANTADLKRRQGTEFSPAINLVSGDLLRVARESGVIKSQYSTDGGANWIDCGDTLSYNGDIYPIMENFSNGTPIENPEGYNLTATA